MAPVMATGRLRKELIKLQKEPPPGVIAEPKESDILVWHYAIKGPSGTPYDGGVYVGKLKFPSEYPMKGPSIQMMTPSGRFQINTRLCMSMSNFHPESWNPMWSVSSIIQGIQSFMASDELTTGGLKSTESEQKKLAACSMAYNQKMFADLFSGDITEAFAQADKARIESEKNAPLASQTATIRGRKKTIKKQEAISADEEKDKSEEDDQEDSSNNKELTPEEIVKRQKKNAKKRAKQKAKKQESVASSEGIETTA